MPPQPSPFGNALEAEKRVRRLRSAFRAVSRRYDQTVQRRSSGDLIPLLILAAIVGATMALLLINLAPLISN
jgi:hypothetical protein